MRGCLQGKRTETTQKKKVNIQNIHGIVGKRVMLESQSIELEAYLAKESIEKNSFIKFPYQPNALLNSNEKERLGVVNIKS